MIERVCCSVFVEEGFYYVGDVNGYYFLRRVDFVVVDLIEWFWDSNVFDE